MAIYLVQHGKCLAKDEDPERGLSDQGRSEVHRIAQVAAGYGIRVSQIRHSGKKRALQTAEIMDQALNPEEWVLTEQGINPLDDVVTYARSLDIASNVMIVGHLPFLEKLTAYLVTGQDQKPVFQLQNGGILCLGQYSDSDQVVVKWALMPNIG